MFDMAFLLSVMLVCHILHTLPPHSNSRSFPSPPDRPSSRSPRLNPDYLALFSSFLRFLLLLLTPHIYPGRCDLPASTLFTSRHLVPSFSKPPSKPRRTAIACLSPHDALDIRMLTSRGLRALLLGLSATASVLNRHVLPVGTGGQVQISGGEASEAHHSLAEGTQQGLEVTRGVKRRQTGSRTDRSQSQDSSSQTSNGSKWSLQPREVLCSQANGTDYTCPNGLTCCLSTAGQPDCCPIGNIECVGGSCVPPPPQEPS